MPVRNVNERRVDAVRGVNERRVGGLGASTGDGSALSGGVGVGDGSAGPAGSARTTARRGPRRPCRRPPARRHRPRRPPCRPRPRAAPCTTSAIRGPPATTTMKTPCSRPRTASSAAVCSMLVRNAEEAMSAAPPTTSISSATTSIGRRPAPGQADRDPEADHRRAPDQDAAMTARPCGSTRETQPEKTPPSTAPAGIAAKSSAKARPPAGGAAEVVVRDLGEQRPRHAEDHRDQVDDERHQQHRVPAQVGSPSTTERSPGVPVAALSTSRAAAAAGPPRRAWRRA